MEFKIQQSEFLKGLRLAQSTTDRNVLLRITGQDKLFIAATDLNVSISAELISENAAKGEMTVYAKALHDVVSRLPRGALAARHSGQSLQIAVGGVECELPAAPSGDFPRNPDSSGVEFGEVDSNVLREMIDRTLFSVSNDESRVSLNGVLFESNGSNARMVSTDGHRLSKVDRPLVGGPNLSSGIIVPKKGVQEIKKVIDTAGTVSLGVKTPYLFVRGDAMILAVKLIGAPFPPHDKVIPKEYDIEVVFDGDSLQAALWRALPICDERRGIMLRCDGTGVRLAVDRPDIVCQSEPIAAFGWGEPWSICLNPRYMYEHIESMASRGIQLRMSTDPLAPFTLRAVDDPDHIGVIMPMNPW